MDVQRSLIQSPRDIKAAFNHQGYALSHAEYYSVYDFLRATCEETLRDGFGKFIITGRLSYAIFKTDEDLNAFLDFAEGEDLGIDQVLYFDYAPRIVFYTHNPIN